MQYNTPLYSALLKEAKKNKTRMHMPGHKGKFLDAFKYSNIFEIDYTEIESTGNLYEGLKPISDAENLMAKAYSAEDCLFLTGGSTQGIMTSIACVCSPNDSIIVDRGCHKSVFNAMVHLDLNPIYIYPNNLTPWDISAGITTKQVEGAIKNNKNVSAVLITSPTYYGVISDIAEISKVTNKYSIPLIVDEAHGAHLPFIEEYFSSISNGADLVVCSAHKTLPALTSGAFLLTNGQYDMKDIRQKASMFGTSSPSYPIMASLDVSRGYLENEGRKEYQKAADILKQIRKEINEKSCFKALEDNIDLKIDPTRLTVNTSNGGLSGYKAAEILENEYDITCEMADNNNVVMIITCMDSEDDLNKIKDAILSLEKNTSDTIVKQQINFPNPKLKLTPRQAVYSQKEYKKLKDCVGKTLGENLSPYPPGIPVVAAGEVIEKEHIEYLIAKNFDVNRETAIIKNCLI